jgi:hypothetical protein
MMGRGIGANYGKLRGASGSSNYPGGPDDKAYKRKVEAILAKKYGQDQVKKGGKKGYV